MQAVEPADPVDSAFQTQRKLPISQIFACDIICAKPAISTAQIQCNDDRGSPPMSGDDAREVDHLIETDPRILELVHKELNQEYLRLMSRALQMSRTTQPGATPPQATPPNSSEKSN
jgi:hypothetical protein